MQTKVLINPGVIFDVLVLLPFCPFNLLRWRTLGGQSTKPMLNESIDSMEVPSHGVELTFVRSLGHLRYIYTDHVAVRTKAVPFGEFEWGPALNPVIIVLALCINTNPKRVQGKRLTRQASLNIYYVWPPSTTHTTNTHWAFAFLPPIHALCCLRCRQLLLFFFSFSLLADNHRSWAGLWCVMMLNINVWR